MTDNSVEYVVYIIGAGFSAPLGLPLVANFIEKARDQYAAEPKRYVHFRRVFDRMNLLARVRTAYHAPLHNIEEVLSLMEMQDTLANGHSRRHLEQFILDVVNHYTPQLAPPEGLNHGNWHNFAFSVEHGWDGYLKFVAGLFRLAVQDDRRGSGGAKNFHEHITPESLRGNTPEYAVITLNYDRVLELCANHLEDILGVGVRFATDDEVKADGVWRHVPLAKLHGDVESGRIVPPTWSKGRNREVIPSWRRAYQVLAGATQIRVLGYSLAESDTYVRYLLKTAALQSERLKRFDVACLDVDGSVHERFARFVDLPGFRFVSARAESFLAGVPRLRNWADTHHHFVADGLEAAHERLMLGQMLS